MPIGPYKDFSTCVTAMQNKGKSAESAKAICGEMQQRIEGAAAVPIGPFERCLEEQRAKGIDEQTAIKNCNAKNNNKTAGFLDPSKSKLYVKAFLLDTSLNLNKWRVTKDSVDQNINSFIGKPLVLTEKFDHPSPNDGGEPESLNHWLSYQEPFRVGTIIDIVTKPNPVFDSTIYYAIIEVQDDNLKQSLRDNSIPVYVSPGIAELIPAFSPALPSSAKARIINGEFVDEVANWTGVHLAIVDEPAFGIKKAVISDQCGGDKESCLLQLRKAHVEKFGIGKCGFCTKKALEKYAFLRKLASIKTVSEPSNSNQILNTSHKVSQVNNQTGNYRKMSQLEQTELNSSTAVTQQQQLQQQNQQQQNELVEKVEQRERPETRAPINVPATPTPTTFTDLMNAYQKLSDENKLLKIKNEELYNVKDTLSERVAALETQSKREAVERIITADVIKDPKQRLERIKYFVSSNIPLDQIEELYKDMKITLRKASINSFASSSRTAAAGRVPYLSASNKNTTADEEGMT